MAEIKIKATSTEGINRSLMQHRVKTKHVYVRTAGGRAPVNTHPCEAIAIKALAGNSGNVYVGDSAVTNTNGYELDAKDGITIETYLPANSIYIYADTKNDGVSVFILR